METTMAFEVEVPTLDIYTGRWKWSRDTAVYTNPNHADLWLARDQEVIVKGRNMRMTTKESYKDGSVRTWVWDGAFDGVPRLMRFQDTGETELQIAFIIIAENVGGDVYQSGPTSPGGQFRGAEHFVLTRDNVKVWGSMSAQGQQASYFEEWFRVE